MIENRRVDDWKDVGIQAGIGAAANGASAGIGMGAGSALAARGASVFTTTIGTGAASGASFGAINSAGTQLNTTGTIDIGQLAGDIAVGGVSGGAGGALAHDIEKDSLQSRKFFNQRLCHDCSYLNWDLDLRSSVVPRLKTTVKV